MKEYFNEPTEFNYSEVIQNDIGKEMNIQIARKRVNLKLLLENLLKKRQIYVVHYFAIYGPKKSHEKETFQKYLKDAEVKVVFKKKDKPLLAKSVQNFKCLANSF